MLKLINIFFILYTPLAKTAGLPPEVTTAQIASVLTSPTASTHTQTETLKSPNPKEAKKPTTYVPRESWMEGSIKANTASLAIAKTTDAIAAKKTTESYSYLMPKVILKPKMLIII